MLEVVESRFECNILISRALCFMMQSGEAGLVLGLDPELGKLLGFLGDLVRTVWETVGDSLWGLFP